MKLIHLSDLHLGKRVNEYSMLEDQNYILRQILQIIDDERPDAVLIAGDVYDKTVPSAEAVSLFDWFLNQLAIRKTQVFCISGNHDSAERLAFGSALMDGSGIHMSRLFLGAVKPFTLEDEYGKVDIWMLPFIKPAAVRGYFDVETVTYTDAVENAIDYMQIDPDRRNVLITHQFVTGARRSESEEVSVGGADNVDAEVFEPFDYVALGHLHSPQNCGTERIRYCGTPLKYSFSEARDRKSVTVAELGRKGDLTVRTVDLTPRRDMVELRGTYDQVTLKAFYENTTWQRDYVHITLTDEEDVPDAIGKLRVIYPYLMKLDYDNARTRFRAQVEGAEDVENRTPQQLFADFYEKQNNRPMSPQQEAFMAALIEKTWEGEQ